MTDPSSKSRNESGTRERPPVVSPPHGYDPDWRERIEIARQARDQARKARRDQPVTFDRTRLPI